MTTAMGEPGINRDVTAYRASDWTVADLLALKGDRTVSVVVPARDEEATVGAVVERLVADLGGRVVDEVPLVASAAVQEAGFVQRLKDGLTRPYTLAVLLVAATGSVLLARAAVRRRRRRDGGPRRTPEVA